MDDIGRHWLSFSNSDQRALTHQTHGSLWDGLVVPGTLATFYKQGVGGYVLARRRPFVIDPRTPLIQPIRVNRPYPRASHETLAEIHNQVIGVEWASHKEVEAEAWTNGIWEDTVRNVLAFQSSFEEEAREKIGKYEEMLQQADMSLDLDEPVRGPCRLIPPYWAVRRTQERWWELSRKAIEQAVQDEQSDRVMPVLCVEHQTSPGLFRELIAELPGEIHEVFCWRGSWDEAEATTDEIEEWLALIDDAAMRDLKVMNMYGGAFSVLLTGFGLHGVNHGVGYSESRDERRLGQTGAPPMRYYIPRLKGFYPVPTAQRLLYELEEPDDDWRCRCSICADRTTIVNLSTEDLKMHFLLSRATEFEAAEDPATAIAELDADAANLMERFAAEEPENDAPYLGKRARAMSRWAETLGARI